MLLDRIKLTAKKVLIWRKISFANVSELVAKHDMNLKLFGDGVTQHLRPFICILSTDLVLYTKQLVEMCSFPNFKRREYETVLFCCAPR
jgi:hypothetical protein